MKTSSIAGWAILGLVVVVTFAALAGCFNSGRYDEEVCASLGYQSRKWVESDLRRNHGLDQYEAVDAVDHAIREYCPGIELR